MTAGADVVVRDAVKRFGPVSALQGASLDVGRGEMVAVTGPSGSGKSTLLNVIGSLETLDAGTVEVAGQPVPEPKHAVDFRRQMVGFVFQDNRLLPFLSVAANIEAALIAAGVGRSGRHERGSELLGEVGLTGRAGNVPAELSGGQRQAVAIARALANRPRLLLADEPTGALDSDSAARVLDLLARLRERHGMTVLIVSHDPTVAERADRVVRLVDGRVAD